METEHTYDVVIIGGGASGTALLYTLARYTNVSGLALLEKNDELGGVNSNPRSNSQTLHVGDIETNYSLEKARSVKPAAMMVAKYVEGLPEEERSAIVTRVQKMVLGVGEKEVAILEKRHQDLRELFPELQKLDREGIVRVEPAVVEGREDGAPVAALFNPAGYAVNFQKLSESLARNALKEQGKRIDMLLGRKAKRIEKCDDGYVVHTSGGVVRARVVVVDADAYSLGFAKALGYGLNFSLIPIAGTFYFSPSVLKGKVYTVQDPRLPFAAVHGDPDVLFSDVTRWGPTARFFPVLESKKLRTSFDYFRASGLMRLRTWKSFVTILFDPTRFWYLFKNIVYDFPVVGKYLFVGSVKKIVPRMRAGQLVEAKGFGGMRLQRVDTTTHELLLGEGKITGENIIFNMSPSPGASVCLYNGMRDAEQIMTFFGGAYRFDKARMVRELVGEAELECMDVSLKTSYSS